MSGEADRQVSLWLIADMESFAHMGSIHVISSATSLMANVEYSSGVVGALLCGIRFGKSNFICVVCFLFFLLC